MQGARAQPDSLPNQSCQLGQMCSSWCSSCYCSVVTQPRPAAQSPDGCTPASTSTSAPGCEQELDSDARPVVAQHAQHGDLAMKREGADTWTRLLSPVSCS